MNNLNVPQTADTTKPSGRDTGVFQKIATTAVTAAGLLGLAGCEEKKQPSEVGRPVVGWKAQRGQEVERPVAGWKAEWGQEVESNPVYFYMVRYEFAWQEAKRLGGRREILMQEINEIAPGKKVPVTLQEAIEEFNRTVEFAYMKDCHGMFGDHRKKPDVWPGSAEYKPVPAIEVITLPENK
jgi:hypothetical protein